MVESSATSPKFSVKGCDTEVFVLPGESAIASSATFHLENHGMARKINVISVKFKENEKVSTLETFHLYSEDDELHEDIYMEENSNLFVRINFPYISIESGTKKSHEILAKFYSNGDEYEAASKLIFVFELDS